jgi:uncharacterized membrane protein YbhN (UPF0104 family)
MNRPEFFKRKSIRIAIAILMTAASFWVMLRLILISKEQLIDIPASFQIAPLLLTLPLFLVTTLLTSFIWGQMMSIFDNRIPISQHIVIYLATLFAGRLPGGIWNVVGRIAWYDQLGIRKRITTFVSILQWFMIIWSGTIVLLLVIPWIIGFSVKNLMILVGLIFVIALLLNPKVVRLFLKKMMKDVDLPEIKFRKIFSWLVLYLLIWILGGTILYLVTVSFYPGVSSWLYGLAAWSAAGVSGTLVTFLPSGLGLVELVSSLVLSIQIPSSISVVVSLVMRILLTGYEFILTLTFLLVARIRYPGRISQD